MGEEGETPVWDPIGFGVGPIRGIVGHCGGRPHSGPIGFGVGPIRGIGGRCGGGGGDPNMGPYRDFGGRPY